MKLRHLLSCLPLLLVLVACGRRAETAASAPEADDYEISQVLSNQFVHSIAEDSLGHIWIGTFRGLNRYDSRDFHHYFASAREGSLPDDQIKHIFRDSRGRLWIATVDGVCRYTDADAFATVAQADTGRYVKEIVETSDGTIFFNAFDGSLLRYLPDADSCAVELAAMEPGNSFFISLHPDSEGNIWIRSTDSIKRYNPSSRTVSDSLALDRPAQASFAPFRHEIWLTGPGGLRVFDTRTRRFRKLPDAIASHPGLAGGAIVCIHPYGDDGVLLATDDGGMFLFDRAEGRLLAGDADGFPFEVPDFRISTMFTDSRGNLWFGSEDRGYAVHYHYKERFNNNNYLRSALAGKSVVSVAGDPDNRLWIVTKRDGIYIYEPSRNGLIHVPPSAFGSAEGALAPPAPYHVCEAGGSMWVMLGGNAMAECTLRDGRFHIIGRHDVWMPMQSFCDRDNTLWVGTASPELYYKREDDATFSRLKVFDGYCFTPALAQFDDNHILALSFNHQPKIVDTRTLEVAPAPCDTAGFAAALRRSVFIPTCVRADGDSVFWIGTVANGLLRYRPADGSFRRVDGMPCSDISSIEEDSDGRLWVGTLHGLARLDPATMKAESFFAYDGTGGNQFYDRACARMRGGTLVFGGTHGLTFFRPKEVSATPEVDLLFENLKIHNRIVRPEPGGSIERHLMYAPPVRLAHDCNSFSISFVALDYCENSRVPCRYRLAGFDADWVDAGDRHEASYANIPPGSYRFELMAPSGDTHRTIALDIAVLHPWWSSPWAIALYVAAGLVALWLLYATLRRIRAERTAALEARRAKEEEQRVNAMNMRFFSNVSHEFRTPLTMIAGPVSRLADAHCDADRRAMLDIIRPNVDRMLRLVDQMLDFNRLENDALRLGVRRTDVLAVLRLAGRPFEATARSKGVAWATYGMEDEFMMWLDEDKLIKIYTNLLSNALKYTPRGGTVRTSFDVATDAAGVRFAVVTVENTGPRIPDDKLEKIFERYYRLDDSADAPGGSGIGLYYARRLAGLHHGALAARQPRDFDGACFVLMLPADRTSYADSECAPAAESGRPAPEVPVVADSPEPAAEEGRELVLVVDDDVDMARYIRTLLAPHYNVALCFDGDDALRWLETNTPALIISDVVMPGRDGLSLCRTVKDDVRLCHIPLMLVTAKAAVESQIEGLEANADAYISKPFDPNLLLSGLRSLLFNRRKARQIATSSTSVDDVDEKILAPADSAFLSRLYELMEQEIADSELDIADISRLMCISRTKFYYKVKGLTGETPGAFFRIYKLNRAAELILEGRHTLSEIADMTGFTSLSHFSRSFKKQFGVAPSDYRPA